MKTSNVLHHGLFLSFLFCGIFTATAKNDDIIISGVIYHGNSGVLVNQAVDIYNLPWDTGQPVLVSTGHTNSLGYFYSTIYNVNNGFGPQWMLVTYDPCFQANDTIVCEGLSTSPYRFYTCRGTCNASFTANNTTSNFPVYFTNTSAGSQVEYNLDFGDGTSYHSSNFFTSAMHVYAAGNYTACLHVGNPIVSDDTCVNLAVQAQNAWNNNNSISFDANVFAYSTNGSCAFQFYLNQYSLAGNSVKIILNYGDGLVDTTEYNPDQHGKLQAFSFHRDHHYSAGYHSAIFTRLIYAAGTLAFTNADTFPIAIPNSEFQYTINQYLYSFQSIPQETGTIYSWNFGDGTTMDSPNPTHSFAPGNYPVCLTAHYSGFNCYEAICQSISVSPPCNAAFTRSTGRGGSFSFHNHSTSAVSYTWDFGDGTTSTDVNPVHRFSPGRYNVCLTVSNNNYRDDYCESVEYTFRNVLPLRSVIFPAAGKNDLPPAEALPLSVSISPNPFHDRLQIETSSPNDAEGMIMVNDVAGKLMYEHSLTFSAGENSQAIDLSNYETGIYIVRFILKEEVSVFKVLKE